MVERQTVSLRQLGASRAGEVRYGRFLHNPRVTTEKLIEAVCGEVGERGRGEHVLLIQDTSELNYQAHAQRVKGLGTVGNGYDAGLFVHPVLAVHAEQGACLGLAHLHLWQRTKAKARNYKALPIEDKESMRWIDAAQKGRQAMPGAGLLTVVADREADIYELWDRLPDKRTHVLVRACRDRKLHERGGTLYDWLAALPERGRYEIDCPQVAGKRSAHRAVLQVRFDATRIERPRACSDRQAPEWIEVCAIEVTEDAGSVVGDEEPIHWRLLTTHCVDTLEQAHKCIGWYCQRWNIEQLFRTLKRQGLDIESSLVEDAQRLEKLAVLGVAAAVRTMQLTMAREGHSHRAATDCFDAQELAVLDRLGPTLQGKTEKQKNPHAKRTLAWAGWIIARLGGWKGYASERKPGPITMLHGLQAFANVCSGWALAFDAAEDVCIR